LPTTARRRRWVPLAVALLGLVLVVAAALRRMGVGASDGLSYTLLFCGLLAALVGAILSLRLLRSRRETAEGP
jgi:hypothetical protein